MANHPPHSPRLFPFNRTGRPLVIAVAFLMGGCVIGPKPEDPFPPENRGESDFNHPTPTGNATTDASVSTDSPPISPVSDASAPNNKGDSSYSDAVWTDVMGQDSSQDSIEITDSAVESGPSCFLPVPLDSSLDSESEKEGG